MKCLGEGNTLGGNGSASQDAAGRLLGVERSVSASQVCQLIKKRHTLGVL